MTPCWHFLNGVPKISQLMVNSVTVPIPSSGSATFMQAALSDHGAVGHYNFTVGYGDNPGDPARGDHVLTIGYNTHNGGGRKDLTEPCFEWRIEDYYKPDSDPAWMEAHWQYYDPAGNGYRPIGWHADRTVGGYLLDEALVLKTNSLSYLGLNDTQYAKFQPGLVSLLNGTALSVAGGITHGGNIRFNTANSGILPGATKFVITNTAASVNNLQLTDAGNLSVVGSMDAASYKVGGVAGATGTFANSVTVVNGIVTGGS